MSGDGQWAQIYGWVFTLGLDATALNVLGIMAAKAGRERVMWSLSREDIGKMLSPAMAPTTVGRAQKRLERAGCIERAGKRIVHPETGGYRQMWRIQDYAPGLKAAIFRSMAGAPDQQEVRPERTSWGDDDVQDVQEVRLDVQEVRLGVQEVRPGRPERTQSLRFSPHSSVDAQSEIEREPNHQPNGAAKKEEGQGLDLKALPKIGTYSRFDPANPKDRAIRCAVPGCGKYNHRRTYCDTHPVSEVMPFIEAAAIGEGGSQ